MKRAKVMPNEIHRDTMVHRKAVYKMANKSANIVAREDDFNQRMALGLMQAKKGEGRLADDVFNDLLSRLEEMKNDR